MAWPQREKIDTCTRHWKTRGLESCRVGPHGDGWGMGMGQMLSLHLLLKRENRIQSQVAGVKSHCIAN